MKKPLLTLLLVSTLCAVPQKPQQDDFFSYFKKTYPVVTGIALGVHIYNSYTNPTFFVKARGLRPTTQGYLMGRTAAFPLVVSLIGSLATYAFLCSRKNKNFMQESFNKDQQRKTLASKLPYSQNS